MKIIEDLYYGEIETGKASTEQLEIVRLIEKNEECLLKNFTDKQKEDFEKFCDCFDELSEICQREAFIRGFAMGARIIIDVTANIT